MARRSPQEKKQLSYERDRRNVYGENDKSSRKAIPFRKRAVNKANRHADHQILLTAAGVPDSAVEEQVDDRLRGRLRKRWRKQPDRPLGEVLESKGKRRRTGD
jgi:hypothetical protein